MKGQIEQINLNYLSSQENFDELHFDSLNTFSCFKKFERLIMYTDPFIILKSKILKWGKGYILIKDKKKYYFEAVSTKGLNKVDIKRIRESFGSLNELIFMCLRVTAHHYLNNTHFILGKTDDRFKPLVSYSKKGKEYIIDFDLDVIMEKSKYYELYDIKEISVLDQNQVYNVWMFCSELDFQVEPVFVAIFYPEIMKKYWYKEKSKYNRMGINKNNYFIFGADCDCAFRNLQDVPIPKDYNTICTFTLDPTKKTKGIKRLSNGVYKYKGYKFELISEGVDDEETRKDLLSNGRYGHCHEDSLQVMHSLYHISHIKKVSIVSGYAYYGEKDYLLHSWVEIEGDSGTVVMDYTNNIIMTKKDYYKLLGIKPISKITCEDYEELESRFKELDVDKNARFLEYFGNEILNDLNRNKFLFKR